MKKMVKKLTLGFLGMFGFLALGLGVVGLSSQADAQGAQPSVWGWDNQNVNYNPNVVGSEALANDNLITSVKTFINWVIGLLALIALAILLWGGFQMLTAAGDDGKYKKGFTILKQAGIALAFIALSWLIVSLIFYVINLATGNW